MTNATPTADRSTTVDGLALGAALVTVVLWASAFVGIRALAEDVSPGVLALGRLAIGSLALTLIVALRRPAMPPRRTLPLIVAVGVLWFGGYNLALNAAEREVDAGTAAMLVNIGPILIAVFGGLFLGEGFPARLFAGSSRRSWQRTSAPLRRPRSSGWSTWASSRPRSRSRPGRMRWAAPPPAASAQRPISYRQSRSCWAGSSWERRRRRWQSRVGPSRSSVW